MLQLHVNVYALPEVTLEGPVQNLRGHSLPTLVGEIGAPPQFIETLPVTFETMQQRLAKLPRCDYEPDGYFLISGHNDSKFWRLNGHIHEYDERLHRVELNGDCPMETLDMVLSAMGWPEVDLAFELVQEGVTLLETSFRAWAEQV